MHPTEDNGRHELYLMTDDIKAFVSAMVTQPSHVPRLAIRGGCAHRFESAWRWHDRRLSTATRSPGVVNGLAMGRRGLRGFAGGGCAIRYV